MYQAQRVYNFDDLTTKPRIVNIIHEDTIGISMKDLNGKEIVCCNGSRSPLFPDDLKLSHAELVKKDGYDCDQVVEAVAKYVRENYTLSADAINDIVASIKGRGFSGMGTPNCAFNI